VGTYVKIAIENVVIPAGNVAAAHAALRELWTDKPTGWLLRRRETSFDGPENWRGYAWVFYKEGGYPTLGEELLAWRYESSQLPDGSVRLDRYRGEKWGDDEALYRALAPFVAGHGDIHIQSEEDHEYRYHFGEGSLRLEHRNSRLALPWQPMPFWGEGPERERAIESRARREKMERELRQSEEQQARERAAKPPPPEADASSERGAVPVDPIALRLWGVRRRGVQ
jgi:hypothetical protein